MLARLVSPFAMAQLLWRAAPVWARLLVELAAFGAILLVGLLLTGDPRVLWGASGIGGAAFLKNLPQEGTYAVNEPLFNRETERNDVQLPTVGFTAGNASPIDIRIPNVGILGNVRLVLDATMTVGTAAAQAGHQFPYNLFKRLTLNANGQTSLISAEGLDFRARQQRVWRNSREQVQVCPATDVMGDPTSASVAVGTYPIKLVWDFPIVHDDESLAGALFSQSDQNYLSIRVQPGALGEMFTLGSSVVSITGSITPVLTYYDIPQVQSNGHDLVVIPDLSWLHGFLSNDKPFANTGEVKVELIRSSGQLLAFMARIDNGDQAVITPQTLTELRWTYGANRKPRVQSPTALLHKNQRDYDGLIRPGYYVFDFEVDNAPRDLVYPKGLTELSVEQVIPAGTTINANARTHTVLDTLYMGV